jgi:zinc transport system substrate-binding protein
MTNNKTHRFHAFLSILLLAILLPACAASQTTNPEKQVDTDLKKTPESRLHVMVSIVPQQYFVERIGGDHVNVSVMVEPGASPATYEPKPEQLKALSDAAAYFSIGVPFESAWLDKIADANQNMLMVDTIANVERQPMTAHEHHAEEVHEDEEDGTGEGTLDPHVWLSPKLVKLQSQAIYEALVQIDPAHRDDYQANLEAFMADIDDLESYIEQTLSGSKSNKFMVFHPAWGYFASDFGLEQIPVEVEGQEPSPQELARLIEEARAENIQVILAQPEFSTQDAETIAQEIDGEVLLVSPLAPDWLANMRQVAQTFSEVLDQ